MSHSPAPPRILHVNGHPGGEPQAFLAQVTRELLQAGIGQTVLQPALGPHQAPVQPPLPAGVHVVELQRAGRGPLAFARHLPAALQEELERTPYTAVHFHGPLVGLVGSQLGQTLLKGGQSRSVLWTSVGSFAALGLIVQTPGLSQLFGCRPLGPVAWTTGLVSSAGVTLLSPVIDSLVDRVADLSQVVRARAEEFAYRNQGGRAETAVRALASSGVRLIPG